MAITDVPLAELPRFVGELGLKRYTAGQLVGWLYKRGVASFDEMTNIARDARAALGARFVTSTMACEDERRAADGTRKFVFRLYDGARIESVLIPGGEGRTTLCISTQVGCALQCAFCRTAEMGFRRNLSQGEILGQVIHARRVSPTPLTNLVFMGMGEPMLNVQAVEQAIRVLTDEQAFNFSKRRITVSTAGMVTELESFAARVDVKIAISLNATTDEQRERLMPINKHFPLGQLMEFCRTYAERAKHRVTFEYVMIKGVNDSMEDAERLVGLLQGMRAKVNLIPFNPFPGTDLCAPDGERLLEWQEYVAQQGVQINLRVSRGGDIFAACGQLAAHSMCGSSTHAVSNSEKQDVC